MKNLTFNQWLLIIVAILGAVAASTTQLMDLFGPTVTKSIQAGVNLCMTVLSAIVAATSGQANLVRAVEGMPGVEKITVNEQANKTLASLAVDPAREKIEPVPVVEKVVQQIANGGIDK